MSWGTSKFYQVKAACLKLTYLCKGSAPVFIMLHPARLSLTKAEQIGQAQNCNSCLKWQSPQPFRSEVYFQHHPPFSETLAFCLPLRYTLWGNGVGALGEGNGRGGGQGRRKKLSSKTPAECPLLPSQVDVLLLELLISYQQCSSLPHVLQTWLSKSQAQRKI